MARSSRVLALGAGALLALAGCAPAAPTPAPVPPPAAGEAGAAIPAAATTRASQAADALGKDLMGLLFATLEAHGPVQALAVCADSAQLRTARHARDGVSVRRTSLRVRNPLNRPDTLEERVLQQWAAAQQAGQPPAPLSFVRRAPGGTRELHYLRPILLMPRCETCHGDPAAIPAEVKQLLAERYPQDRATGFRAGQLRGAVSVRVPLE